MQLLSHPFRLAPDGTVATVTQGSDAEAAEAIIVLAGTTPGERELVPGFGLADPTFGDGIVDIPGLAAGLALYGPSDVVVLDAATSIDARGRAVATVSYQVGDPGAAS